MDQVWLANLVTGGVVLSVMGWLILRFIGSFEKRLAASEKKADEIEENYISRFKEVNLNLSASENNIRKDFNTRLDRTDEKIDKVIHEKLEHRVQQGRWQGVMEEKLNNVVDTLKHRP